MLKMKKDSFTMDCGIVMKCKGMEKNGVSKSLSDELRLPTKTLLKMMIKSKMALRRLWKRWHTLAIVDDNSVILIVIVETLTISILGLESWKI